MTQPFEQFIATSSTNISILGFILNIVLSAVLATLLSWVYIKYGNSLSNRRQFAKNFLIITMTTMFIITIVKSSLALSLGLVGALSIIRFRAAIKEPEELAYLFLTIAVGLGFGANQTGITLLAFMLILILIIISKKFSKKYHDNQNLHLTIQSKDSKKVNIEAILEVLKRNCDEVDLRRLDETSEYLEVSFMVEAKDFAQLNNAKAELQKLDNDLKITFLDNKGLM
jgi:hypothetical protein